MPTVKVQIKKLPKSEVEITVTVPYPAYLEAEKEALKRLNSEVKLDGFRSGHIPEDVIREKVGEESIRQATLEHLLPKTYSQAVKEHNLQVIAAPKVEIKTPVKKEGDELVYVARVAVMPEIKVGDYKKIKVKKKPAELKPGQLEETLLYILDRFSEWKQVERPAQKGDRAEVTFEGFDTEGKSLPNTKSQNHPLILGSNTMIPGFEEAIMGAKAGETRDFELTFPKTYHSKDMQGKKVKFNLTLHRLEEKISQELNEILIEKITGQKQTVDAFKKRVEDDLKNEVTVRSAREHESQVVEAILKITQVEIPQALIDEEVEYIVGEKKEEIGRQGLTWEQYLQHLKKTEDDFKKDNQKPTEERLRARLGVQFIMQDAKIQPSDEQVNAEIEKIAARYPQEEQKKVRDHYKNAQSYQRLKGSMAADQLIAMLSE